jgi:glycolate oxidase
MVAMPALDQAVLGRRADIVAALRAIVPGEGVIDSEVGMRPFESDGLTAYRQMPMVVVLPETTEQVSRILRYCHENGVKVVPRGAGTSLSGGALPLGDGVLLGLSKFNRILDIDYENRAVVVQPGVTNLGISNAVAERGFYYAPDPSSQIACSIGGNVAENSGGVHCLKYGMTTNNILGVEMVLIDGEVVRIGGKHMDCGGYDLLALVCGSEGLLGVVTEVTVRILQKPETARAVLVGFPSSEQAGDCVAKTIGAGIIPGGMEMMDRPAIHAAEAFVHAGYPLDVEALLIVELDGPEAEVDDLLDRVSEIAKSCGATVLRASTSEEERLRFWAGRKAAFASVGRISPDYYCMDGTIPRAKLPLVLARMRELSEHYRLQVANVFHAGDGNLHPLILVRREQGRRTGACRAVRRRHPAALRRSRRRADRRAWRRGREARSHAGHVFRERSQSAAAREMRVRRQGPPQSRQSLPDAAPLRRTRPHARACRQAAVSRHPALLV